MVALRAKDGIERVERTADLAGDCVAHEDDAACCNDDLDVSELESRIELAAQTAECSFSLL